MSPMESSVNDMVKGKIHARTAHLAIKRGLLHIISTHSDVFIIYQSSNHAIHKFGYIFRFAGGHFTWQNSRSS